MNVFIFVFKQIIVTARNPTFIAYYPEGIDVDGVTIIFLAPNCSPLDDTITVDNFVAETCHHPQTTRKKFVYFL